MKDTYRLLAKKLDDLPNGFPPTPDGAELDLLAKIFSPTEAELAAQLSEKPQTVEQVAIQIGPKADIKEIQNQLSLLQSI